MDTELKKLMIENLDESISQMDRLYLLAKTTSERIGTRTKIAYSTPVNAVVLDIRAQIVDLKNRLGAL